ncbi:class II fumarate hydratase [Candidatus Thorarchaeota archaeon]|nr:MAG: class II fumarate hydratase [Candidatus Thorarchaeota archaeon]
MAGFRRERDSIGELDVPEDAYYGISTQRAIENFRISGKTMPLDFIYALAQVKKACLVANRQEGLIDDKIGDAIDQAIDELLIKGMFADQFPVDVYQTGSGTQTNMNVNEVLANRANEILGQPRGMKTPVHPNDHVNLAQSSNDTIPTAMHVATLTALRKDLLPALDLLELTLSSKIKQFEGIVKVGRTHLQDAVPIGLSTEFKVYRSQIEAVMEELRLAMEQLLVVPLGGTGLGTGINASKKFSERAVKALGRITSIDFTENPVKAEGIASHSDIVRTSGVLRRLALVCYKIANDIRWMGSGPRAGLGELRLPQNEPGSSLMPGKVNPTQSEALIQVCLRVIGNDATIEAAEGFGSVLDLNVCKPLMVSTILESVSVLSGGINSFVKNCLTGLEPNLNRIRETLDKNLMVVTRLTPHIGYDKSAEIAKEALATGKSIKEIVIEKGIDIQGDLDEILDPRRMA